MAKRRVTDKKYIEAARRLYEREGECEIDDNAKISRGDPDGSYVQAWVFVYNDQTK